MNATASVDVADAPDAVVATAEFRASSMSVLVYEQPSIDALMQIGFGARLLPPSNGSYCYRGTVEEFTGLIDYDNAPILTIPADTIELADDKVVTTTQQIEPSVISSVSPLLLLDEEVIYLCRKGRLIVNRSDGSCMTTDELWCVLSSKSSTFVCKYKVYEYYTNNSYVVRPGINFGVDYCLYQRSPSECHSEICITVVDALHDGGIILHDGGEAGRGISCGGSNRTTSEVSWRHITTLTRVVPDVMKLCIICYVLPRHSSSSSSSSSIPSVEECGIRTKLHVGADADVDDVKASLDPSRSDGGLQSTSSSIDAEKSTVQSLYPQTQSTMCEEAARQESCETALARSIEPPEEVEVVVVPGVSNSIEGGGSFDGSQRRVEQPLMARSPYIDLLFSPIPTMDLSTIQCVDSLLVHPVALIVRRTKTNEHNYETIADVQKRLQKSSKPKKPKTTTTILKHGQHIGRIIATADSIADGDDAITTAVIHGKDACSDKADGVTSSSPSSFKGPMHSGGDGDGGGVGVCDPHRGRKKKKSLKQRRDPQEVRQKGLSKSNKVFRKLMRGTGGDVMTTSSMVMTTPTTATMMMMVGEDHKYKQTQKQKRSVMSSSSQKGMDGHVSGRVSYDSIDHSLSSGKRNRSDSMHQDGGMVDGSKVLRVDDEASNRAAAAVALMVGGSSNEAGSSDASMGLLQRCVMM